MKTARPMLALLFTMTILATSSLSAVAIGVDPTDPVEAPANTAQASADVTFSINPGVSATISGSLLETSAPFTDITYSQNVQVSQGNVLVRVADTRGTSAGWTVALRATNFVGTDNGGVILAKYLSFQPGNITMLEGNTDVSSMQTNELYPVMLVPITFWTAPQGSGNGAYSLVLAGSLIIPAATQVDTYTSTITIEITGNAP